MGDSQYLDQTKYDDTNRLFAMYHQTTDSEIQETVGVSFGDPNGKIRVLFCTIAFGMGLNVQAVKTVIHYGPPRDIEQYLQESGRAGRNPSMQSYALLLNYKGSTRGAYISNEIRQYIKNDSVCKRQFLMRELQRITSSNSILHTCCSFCSQYCHCQCSCERKTCTCIRLCIPLEQTISKAELEIVEAYRLASNDSSDDDNGHFELFQDVSLDTESVENDSELHECRPQLADSDSE